MDNELFENLSNEGFLKNTFRTAALTTGIGLAGMGADRLAGALNSPPPSATVVSVQQEEPKIQSPVKAEVEKKSNVSPVIKKEIGDELPVITKAAIRNGVEPGTEDFAILLAIRKAENGKPGREFGVLHPRAVDTDLDTQAGWCAATIMRNRERWEEAGKPEDFITFLGRRYCPVGAENDPQGLNRHWIKNVMHWTERFKRQ